MRLLPAKNWIDSKDGALIHIWEGKFVCWHSCKAFFEVGRRVLFTLKFEISNHLWNVGRKLSQLLLETSVVKGASETLSNGFSDLRISVLNWLLIHRLVLSGAIGRSFLTNGVSNISLIHLLFLRQNLLCQALWQVTSLGIFVEHACEPGLHFSFDSESLPLHILHLLFNRRDALLKDGRVKHSSLIEHSTHLSLITAHHGGISTTTT